MIWENLRSSWSIKNIESLGKKGRGQLSSSCSTSTSSLQYTLGSSSAFPRDCQMHQHVLFPSLSSFTEHRWFQSTFGGAPPVFPWQELLQWQYLGQLSSQHHLNCCIKFKCQGHECISKMACSKVHSISVVEAFTSTWHLRCVANAMLLQKCRATAPGSTSRTLGCSE
jgi:hypothetical protein